MSRPAPVLSHHATLAGDGPAATATLREWYAGLALQGLLAGCEGGHVEHTAADAVRYADALIAALAGEREDA